MVALFSSSGIEVIETKLDYFRYGIILEDVSGEGIDTNYELIAHSIKHS
jgi:hypothetical protein